MSENGLQTTKYKQHMLKLAKLEQLSGSWERTSINIRLNLLIQPYGCLEHTNFEVLVKIQWFLDPPAILIILDALRVTNLQYRNWNCEEE